MNSTAENWLIAAVCVLIAAMIVGGFQLHRWFDHVEYERCISVGGSPGGTGGCNLECRNAEREAEAWRSKFNRMEAQLEICEERRR